MHIIVPVSHLDPVNPGLQLQYAKVDKPGVPSTQLPPFKHCT